jgi:DNA replication protein DnaC
MTAMEKKKSIAKKRLIDECGCVSGCAKCSSQRIFIDTMADANIPEAYWTLSYKTFSGADVIKTSTVAYTGSIDEKFSSGTSVCYAGPPGTGKTMSACTILKAALAGGYSAYYTSLSDLVHYLTDHNYKTSFYHKLTGVDFLCIDEVDARHFAETETSENFFGRSFERIFRYRVQNRLPTIFATNHLSLSEAFVGQFKKIFDSIGALSVETIPSMGPDQRLKPRSSK